MSTGPAEAPIPLSPRRAPRADVLLAARIGSALLDPRRVVVVFWAGGTVATVSVLPLAHWSRPSLLSLVIIAVLGSIGCGVRIAAGKRLPRWTLHADVGFGTVAASALAAVGATGHVAFADLYVWVALFAVLYFRPLAALTHVGAAGAAYGVVLAVGPKVDDPVAAWLAVFGTVAVAGAVVLGLVSALHRTAREDTLTGLANRRSFDERIEEELERSRRTGTALSAVMIDLDGFKAVNDRGGHEAGDHLLRELAGAWRAAVRGGGDFLARIGGDEFGLLAPGSDATSVHRLVKRLGDALPEGVSAAIGVATWDGTESASDLLRRADRAMYEAKLRHRREGLRPA